MKKGLIGWDPLLQAVAEKIPEDVLIDYKLLWRDPVPQWVSPKGRIALVGDAAHPHLATSGQGGAQAIEDAATIAVMVERTHGKDIPIALRAYARLR
jgi:2-polyprenyl-6-methoxyphenol hydroxylase-like FAD-dependent oxidoreductase